MATTDQPKYTAQVHQFDRNPGRGESLLHALADPSPTAVSSEAAVTARQVATGVAHPRNAAPDPYAHRDAVRNANDAASRLH